MYQINELEFIGESLSKINKNFKEAHDRLTAAENQTTQYSGLSSFYATHSNNPDIRVELEPEIGLSGEFELRKSDLIGVDTSKIIYPMPIYVHVSHPETTLLPVLRFSYKLVSSDTGYTATEFTLPRALGSTLLDKSYNTFTLMDLGFYDWKINLLNSINANTKVYAHKLYLA